MFQSLCSIEPLPVQAIQQHARDQNVIPWGGIEKKNSLQITSTFLFLGIPVLTLESPQLVTTGFLSCPPQISPPSSPKIPNRPPPPRLQPNLTPLPHTNLYTSESLILKPPATTDIVPHQPILLPHPQPCCSNTLS
jgi:hypothetical protein